MEPRLRAVVGRRLHGRTAQPEHGAYSLNVCSAAFESRAFAPVLLCLCPWQSFFLSPFFSFLSPSSALSGARFIHFGEPVVGPKRDTLEIDCASDGSEGMLFGQRRLYALKRCWPRLLFWRSHVPSDPPEVDALGSQVRFRSASRTFLNAGEECVFTLAIAAHMQKVHSVPYLSAKRRRVERTVRRCRRRARRLLCCSQTTL